VINATFDTEIIRAATIVPLRMEEMASLLMDAYFYYSRTNLEDQLINAVEFALDED